MPEPRKFEQQFFKALEDIFVGAKVEGDSGYINLMRIKSRYYTKGVFPHLQKDINEALRPSPGFREELFDKLYTFFSRYFSESGSIYFRYTPLHQNVYEKVYTDDRDVMLFWKTHMLYYVKTDRIFNSLNTEVDGVKFFFDASETTLKRANEKRETVYAFRKVDEDGTLVFDVAYSERGKSTKVDDILKAVKQAGKKLDDETLAKAFRVFEKQSEVDYFINKNARAFLEEQFDLWMYQYLFSGQNVWDAERLAQLQTLKAIAYKVIAFIAQFEDELVRVWNKPKFVRNSHYVITLDKISDPGLRDRILAHAGMAGQMEEWRALGMIDDDFSLDMLTATDVVGEPLHSEYLRLPLDTSHFSDLELDILALFDDLDAELDGWLVHSENYQALNTMLPKFEGRVQAVYIDPPYNTDASEIIYVNEYKTSSWLSMMENRLSISRNYLKNSGFHCVAIDDFEFNNLKSLVEQIYPQENFVGTIAVRNNPAGRATARGFSIAHEYLLFVSKTTESEIGRLEHSEQQIQRYKEQDLDGPFEWVNFRKHGGLNARRPARPKLFYPIYASAESKSLRIPKIEWSDEKSSWTALEKPTGNEEVIFPIAEGGEERTWKWGHETVAKNLDSFTVRQDQSGKTGIYMKSRLQAEGTLPRTLWQDSRYSASDHGTNLLTKFFGKGQVFSFPKSIYAVEDTLKVCNTKTTDIVLDYFAGSGTTAHAVMNLNRSDEGKRKYILVEMGAHFETVILPRVKKVAFCSRWKDGKPVFDKNEGGMSHFIKYYELEQYEDALRRARYDDADLFDNPYEDPYHHYIFLRDLKMLDATEVDYEKNTVRFHPERVYENIDLAESLSNLRGKWIKRITKEYVEFEDGEQISLSNPDFRVIKPLVWW